MKKQWQEWEIPREADAKWPDVAKTVHGDWWQARVARQKEIDASIAAKAEFEYLYDKPYPDNRKVRVAGPFTVETSRSTSSRKATPKIRYYIDPETELPHIYRHNVTEPDVDDVLRRPMEDRRGREGARVALGRLGAKALRALRRRRRRKQ